MVHARLISSIFLETLKSFIFLRFPTVLDDCMTIFDNWHVLVKNEMKFKHSLTYRTIGPNKYDVCICIQMNYNISSRFAGVLQKMVQNGDSHVERASSNIGIQVE